ncbi:MAG: cyclic pyranopterin monophosphate synthase MoaC [Luteococcus japonicus]|uniref:cyclic pyranopterin monophosphate synthase MoaC n=1 Tax=Luteococcus sp. TaxID=1969402 RepID=UPI00264A1AA7|nr:cyclic pyranopterin monophosphate synthase MoaC [Luteococcus sp.]
MTERPVFRPSSVDAFIPEVPRVRASQPDGSHPFPHLSGDGEARMVDVSAKEVTARSASAKGVVLLSKECLAALADDALPKGDALAVARIAGVMGAKKTSDLIPLCHPLPLTGVDVHLETLADGIEISATVRTTHRTGVEMEALTAVCTAALGLVDMVKAVDKHARLTDVRVVAKSGGRSGDWTEA